MARDTDDPWQTDAGDYPWNGSLAERLRFLLNYAVLAPSSHNTQPWLFRIHENGVDVLADRTRALPVVDPHDRALTISCGAATGTLEVALRRFGLTPAVSVPSDAGADVLARVTVSDSGAPSDDERALFEAIAARRTNRHAYDETPVPTSVMEEAVARARALGLEVLAIRDPGPKAAVAELVAEGNRRQFADPDFRRELAAWVHSRRLGAREGMSGKGFGVPDVLSGVGALVIRTFDLGKGVAAGDRQKIADGSPVLAVLASTNDDSRAWVETGRALARTLLALTAAGLTAAYLNQPIEVEDLRPRLRETVGAAGHPQLLLRIGHGPVVPPSVRRPLDAVLLS